MQQKIEHPSHPGHWLSYCPQYRKGFTCSGCKEYLDGDGYRCDPCDFDLHVDCAMAPLQLIKHQSHPGHWLSYRAQYPKGFRCNVCRGNVHRDGYTCRFCNFDLHVHCAMCPQPKITHQSHPGHWLSFCAEYPKGYRCNGCGEIGQTEGYRCSACEFDLHVDCAMGPQQKIKHQCHSAHWLSYRAQYPKGYRCDGCGEDLHRDGYRCDPCNFDLHVDCATGPRVLCHPLHSGDGHQFELLTGPPGGVVKLCSACSKPVSRLGYHCTSRLCSYSLHTTCALLRERSGDPADVLVLEEVLSSPCYGCGQTRGPGWGYVKASASVAFHIACMPRILNLKGGAATQHPAPSSSTAPPSKEKDSKHKLEKALKVSELVLDVANLFLTGDPSGVIADVASFFSDSNSGS